MRIRIGVDLDDTLCDFTGPCNDYNTKYGTSYKLSDYTAAYAQVWNKPQNETNVIIDDFIHLSPTRADRSIASFKQEKLEPLLGAQQFFTNVNNHIYEFFLISARDSALQESTEQWITKYFPNTFQQVILCDYYSGKPKRCKTDVCKELGISVMIDDTPDNIKCSSIQTLAFQQPSQRETKEGLDWVYLEKYFSLPNLSSRLSARLTNKKITIALSGKYGSGKDAAAAIIKKYFPEFTCLAFADRLKQTVAAFAGVPLEMLYTREGKAFRPSGLEQTLGQMLQTFGDQFKTLYGVDICTRLTMNQIQSKTIVTDCRCLVEAEALEKEENLLLLRIEGDPVGLRKENKDGRDLNHRSETELDNYPFLYIIHNEGSLQEYEEKILAILLPWLYHLI